MLFAVPHGARRGWRRRVAFGGSRSALVVLTFYVLRSPFYVRRSTFYVLRSTFYVLRSTFYVLRSTFYVLRSTFYVLRSTFYVLRSTFYRSPFAVLRSAFGVPRRARQNRQNGDSAAFVDATAVRPLTGLTTPGFGHSAADAFSGPSTSVNS